MISQRALISASVLALVYGGALLWAERQQPSLHGVPWLALAQALGLTLLSFALRFARWHWLLGRVGQQVPVWRGFLAYLSGFALTATPGKVGELLRMRYFQQLGVPAWRVLAAFLFERSLDLLCVLLLAGLASAGAGALLGGLVFVGLLLGALWALLRYPVLTGWLVGQARQRQWFKLANALRTLRRSLPACRRWFTPLDVLVSAGLGLAAWCLVALTAVLLLAAFDIQLPPQQALSAYPLAMLAGAASMLPGGLGSTEAVLVWRLSNLGVASTTAVVVAVSTRVATLWFAILCGIAAIAWLERLGPRHQRMMS